MNSPADPRQLASARVLVLIAAVLWSSSGFFAKAPFFAGWPGPTLAFWRAIFALVILLPLVRRPVWNWRIVPMSLAFAAMNYTYLSALEFGSAANAIWLQCLAPTWTLLVGVWLLKERASRGDWRMAAFSLAGIGLILFCELRRASTEEHALAAVIFGVSSGMLYAAVVLFLRVLRGADAGWLIAVNHAVTVVALTPWMLGADARAPSGIQWLLLAAFGMLQMGLPYVLFTRSLRSLPGHEASSLALIEPVLVPVWTWLAWGQVPAWWSLVGGGLIFIGLATRYAAKEPHTKDEAPETPPPGPQAELPTS